MATYKTPGVYVEELPKFPHAVAQEPTCTVVFIGYTNKTALADGTTLVLSPVRIRSLPDFVSFFGTGPGGRYLTDAVGLFYSNGGNDAYIISVGSTTEPVSYTAMLDGLNRSREVSVQLIAIPDACLLPTPEFYQLQQQVLETCAALQDRFAILDTLQPSGNVENDIDQYRAGMGGGDRKWGAVYYPWLILSDGKQVPPSGAIAGIYTFVDNSSGVWKAPANVSLNGVSSLSATVSHLHQESMNVSMDGKSINAIRVFPGKGNLVWGARTLDGNSMDWKYINIRRTITMIENSIRNSTSWVVFEPNDANTWVVVRGMIENFLVLLWREGCLAGVKPGDAFAVHVGLGITMTALDILEGRMNITVLLAISRPAEFIEISLTHKMQQR